MVHEPMKSLIKMALRRAKSGSGSSQAFLVERNWRLPIMIDIASILGDLPYVVVGGVATRAYMAERMTLDIDILVHSKNWPAIEVALEAADGENTGALSIGGFSFQFGADVLDVLVSDAPWVQSAITSPNFQNNLPIIALEYLVLLKLKASRSIDLGDLSRMLGQANDLALTKVRETVRNYLPEASEDLESLIILGKLELEN
jgi:hypothetical protein